MKFWTYWISPPEEFLRTSYQFLDTLIYHLMSLPIKYLHFAPPPFFKHVFFYSCQKGRALPEIRPQGEANQDEKMSKRKGKFAKAHPHHKQGEQTFGEPGFPHASLHCLQSFLESFGKWMDGHRDCPITGPQSLVPNPQIQTALKTKRFICNSQTCHGLMRGYL